MKVLFDCKPSNIVSVSDIIDFLASRKGGLYFRGHANKDWPLLPTIARLGQMCWAGRNVPLYDHCLQEKDLLHRFRRRTYEARGRVLTEWEVLFLARHYGLPVRLLDWTINPLVALYFACSHEKQPDEDGAIWWFTREPLNEAIDVFSQSYSDPLEIAGVRLIYPFYPTARMTVQSALFTLHGFPWKDLRFIPKKEYSARECDISSGGCLIVPKNRKGELLSQLTRLGINSRTIFPELDGLAKGLIEEEVFRSGDEYKGKVR